MVDASRESISFPSCFLSLIRPLVLTASVKAKFDVWLESPLGVVSVILSSNEVSRVSLRRVNDVEPRGPSYLSFCRHTQTFSTFCVVSK